MIYHSPAHLPFRDVLVAEVFKKLHRGVLMGTEKAFVDIIHERLGESVLKEVNSELAARGLELDHISVFATPPNNDVITHLDHLRDGDCPCHTSVIIPMLNYETMFWVGGEFDPELLTVERNIKYYDVKWKSDHSIVHEFDITEPTIARIDIPHGAYAKNTRRVLAKLSFKRNPSFEEVVSKLGI
jgi:hypothetical protein